jgi:hypothetical protein
MAFEGESIKLIDQYVGRRLVIVLEVSTIVQMTLETCYRQSFCVNTELDSL